MKRIISLVLALSMILSMFSFSFAASTLKDISGTKYESAVEALMELKIVDGYPDQTYLPDKVVTRGELAKLLVTSYGLSQAAEAASGTTPFSDVAGNWAAGYISVSADNKFVNGYPSGLFKPDETVTYAEAITMCLRVLGYTKEVDSKGTWPTNYISKAQDLKLNKDLEFKSYNDGATRGNIALLIWNMLRTKMWETVGASEGDGLESRANREMIDVKFPDYAYVDDAEFVGFKVEKDSKNDAPKVVITLKSDELTKKEWEYKENDFYKYVPGTEVEVLVNEEDGVVLSIVPTSDNTLVDGDKVKIDDDYEALRDTDYSYVYGLVESKDIVNSVTLTGESIFVDKVEVKEKDKKVVLNKKLSYEDKDYDYEVFLRDGERVKLSSIKEGEILTKVTVSYNKVVDGKVKTTGTEEFYVIGGTDAKGKLKDYFKDTYDDSKVEFWAITIDKDDYKVDPGATYVEDPDKDNVTAVDFSSDKNWKPKMEKEEVTLRLDPIFGRVVRVEFDGKIDGGANSTTYKFYGVTANVKWDSDAERYTVKLIDADGDETFKFAKSAGNTVAAKYEREDITGSFVVAKMNDDDEIKEFEIIARADENEGTGNVIKTSGSYGEDGEKYLFKLVENAKYEKGKAAIYANDKKVNEVDGTVVVVTLNYDDKDEEYSIEFAKGIEKIEKLKDEPVIVVWDESDDYEMAMYVVLFDNSTDNSDNMAGKVTTTRSSSVTVEGNGDKNTYTYKDGKLAKNDVVVYTTKEKDDETTLKVVTSLTVDDSKLQYVTAADGRRAKIDGTSMNLDLDDTKDDYEDYMVVVVDMDGNDVDTVSTEKYDDITFEDFDRVLIDDKNDIFFIFKGMDERTGSTEEPKEEEPATVNYTIQFYIGSGDDLTTYEVSGDAVTKSDKVGAKVTLTSGDVTSPVAGYEFKSSETVTLVEDATKNIVKVYLVKTETDNEQA